MLDFRMETFLAVCRFMNFTRAAEYLNITQPAVSQHIKYLEQHYGVKLFNYSGKKLEITSAGEMLRNASLTMMNDELCMQTEMKKLEDVSEIRFGASRTVGGVIMGPILANYLREYPDTQIHMVVENTQELLKRLDDGDIDFALVEGFFKKTEYDYEKYSDEQFIAICSGKHCFEKEPKIVADLFSERLLLREEGSGTREVLERYLESENYSISDFERKIEAGSLNAIMELTKADCGITFLYEVAVREELKNGTLRKLDLKDLHMTHEFAFIWRRGSIYAEKYKELFQRFREMT